MDRAGAETHWPCFLSVARPDGKPLARFAGSHFSWPMLLDYGVDRGSITVTVCCAPPLVEKLALPMRMPALPGTLAETL